MFLTNDFNVVQRMELDDPKIAFGRTPVEEVFGSRVYFLSTLASLDYLVGMGALHVFERRFDQQLQDGGNGDVTVPVPVPIPIYRIFQYVSVLRAEFLKVH